VQAGLVAAVHPVVLQQVLITLTERLARRITGGEVAIYARLEDGNARITLTGEVSPGAELNDADLVDGIPAASDVSVEVCVDDAHAFVWVETPSVGKITVLVVDDNEDMARFYRGSAVGTRYHIVHTAQGLDLFDIVETVAPDVIVLDVMLPDIDGWRLLMRLREDPATCSVPVIVCSVVREDALALSLGAARFLSKPVRPREFIEALDQVLPPAAARVPTAPASSE
jgi:CheY-like chemotaxis protein